MDTYDNDRTDTPAPYPAPGPAADAPPPAGPAPMAPPQQAQPPRATPISPFANGPYETKGSVPPRYPPFPPDERRPHPKKRSRRSPLRTLLCAVSIVALVIGSCAVTARIVQRDWEEQYRLLALSMEDKLRIISGQLQTDPEAEAGHSSSGTPNVGPEGGLTPAQVFAQNVDAVVSIDCTQQTGDLGQILQTTSSGSGFVLTEDGYIVSNYHVVEDATAITVSFFDGSSHTARYVGGDESNDISVLKIEAEGLQTVTVGRSDDLIVGDQVVAIGDPLGTLASTLTVGYVSAKDRVITTDGTQINMLQTDAAINPGNSGGPLFNMYGEVIGITSAKYSGTTPSGASLEGLGFAIPIDDVIGMLEDLHRYGYITGAYLGVVVSNVGQDAVSLYGLPQGVLVHSVTEGSCAQEGGIKAQDIIVELGGYPIANMNDLTRALRKFQAGEEISLKVYRVYEGKELLLSVILDEKPRNAG